MFFKLSCAHELPVGLIRIQILIQVWDKIQELAFLTNSQMMLMMLPTNHTLGSEDLVCSSRGKNLKIVKNVVYNTEGLEEYGF